MNNAHLYGLRFARGKNGVCTPATELKHVATAYNGVDDAAASVSLNVGDPVTLVNDGSVSLCVAASLVTHVVVGFGYQWDATDGRMVLRNRLANAHAWGTVWERRPQVLVASVDQGVWECDANTAGTTWAAWEAHVGQNCSLVTAADGDLRANPMVNVSTFNTTATLVWRIVGVSKTSHNIDPAGLYVKLLLEANTTNLAGAAALPAVGV